MPPPCQGIDGGARTRNTEVHAGLRTGLAGHCVTKAPLRDSRDASLHFQTIAELALSYKVMVHLTNTHSNMASRIEFNIENFIYATFELQREKLSPGTSVAQWLANPV
ncbi:hypothetical protein PoB_004854100 [Plakobranchus ocellatus]|uniref:Uncharacterized protein n=1 Tax=Plakobranchus ocellatus TaxID=259542 RepID=A0AAV4BSI4_9GAST|nr:hypothetical protein PoB_004854100 [Plakobranchus ocellatus]